MILTHLYITTVRQIVRSLQVTTVLPYSWVPITVLWLITNRVHPHHRWYYPMSESRGLNSVIHSGLNFQTNRAWGILPPPNLIFKWWRLSKHQLLFQKLCSGNQERSHRIALHQNTSANRIEISRVSIRALTWMLASKLYLSLGIWQMTWRFQGGNLALIGISLQISILGR